MIIEATFVPASDLGELAALRGEYLNQLVEAQDASVELLIPESSGFFIEAEGVRCGYFIVHAGETLIEFHLTQPYWVFGECIFAQILACSGVQRAWVKSFDHLLFSSCIALHKSLRVTGILARELIPRTLPALPDLTVQVRTAELHDLPAIMAVDQEVFRHPARLRTVIEAGFMYLFESEGQLVGFGIVRPVVFGRAHVELGIALDRPFRLKGYAAHLLQRLIDACVARGLTPVAGLSPQNVASRAMGERTGLVARYRLLELSFS